MDWLNQFFQELDDSWKLPITKKIQIKLLGSTALMIQTNYVRGTKDTDILQTAEVDAVTDYLKEIAGKDSPLHKRYRAYLDIVPNGLPFLPRPHRFHAVKSLHTLKKFTVLTLDVTDVVVSKLKRFHADDVEDIQAMIREGKVRHQDVISRFQSAFEMEELNGNVAQLRACVRNLHTIERDFFGVPESQIELPED